MDFAKVTVRELRDAARELGINENGAPGKTSWVALATRAEMQAALQAHENGTPIEGAPKHLDDSETPREGAPRDEAEREARNKAIADAMRAAARDEIKKHLGAKRTVIVKESADGEKSEEKDLGLTHRIFPEVLRLLQAGINVYLYGPPGVGKTHLCEQLADALDREYHADSFTPQTSDWRVSGYRNVTDGTFISTPFYHAVTNGGLYLGDEIDKASDGVVGAFNLSLSNTRASFACGLVAKNPATRFVFAGNTVGLGATPMYPDRNVLPADFRDRFFFVEMPVDENLERSLALRENPDASAWVDYVQAVRARVEHAGLPMPVTPRASINGAKALLLGYTQARIADAMIFRAAPESMIRRAKGE